MVMLKVILQYCIAQRYCARFSRHQCMQISACTYTTKEISQAKLDSEINVPFLLNEHGDLPFLVFFETVLGREHSG